MFRFLSYFGPPPIIPSSAGTTTGAPAGPVTVAYQPQAPPVTEQPATLSKLEKSLVAGPVIAYRQWSLFEDGRSAWLESVGHPGHVWPGGAPKVAWCNVYRDHEHTSLYRGSECGAEMIAVLRRWLSYHGPVSPGASCTCGLYAVRDESTLETSAYEPANESNGGRAVAMLSGQVALWGRVIEHEHGYRAQYGYPVKLRLHAARGTMPGFPVPQRLRDALALVRDAYGCEVEER